MHTCAITGNTIYNPVKALNVVYMFKSVAYNNRLPLAVKDNTKFK